MITSEELEQKAKAAVLAIVVLGLIPDALIAFVVMKLTDDEWSTFWWVWIGIQVLYVLYWVKTALWSSVMWRLWLRRRTSDEALRALKACGFPKPTGGEWNVQDYLTRIMEDETLPTTVRIRAAEWRASVHANASRGLQSGMQVNQAWADSLDVYRRT